MLGIVVDVHLKKRKGHALLEILVEASPYPVSYKGQYHYRSGSTKQELKGTALDTFLLRKLGKHWDGVPVPGIKLGDLSNSVIKNFGQLAKQSRRLDDAILKEPMGSLLEKLGLRDGKYLKRAALLLFHSVPESLITGAYTKLGFFRSNSDLRYQDEINGDLFTQVEKTLDLLLTKYLQAGISYRGVQRIEMLPVPEAALREAVLNALIHKDYASGAPIQISVYADKLMVWNPGTLPPDWSVEKLLGKHASEPYNPDIANAFFRAGLIESWGRGIERIFEACHEAGTPEPLLRAETTGVWMEFPFSDQQITGQVAGQVAGQVQKLTNVIQGEMSRTELMSALNLRNRDSFSKRYLKPSLVAGYIEMTIPDKPNSRLQKYRLTEQGSRLRQAPKSL